MNKNDLKLKTSFSVAGWILDGAVYAKSPCRELFMIVKYDLKKENLVLSYDVINRNVPYKYIL